MVFGSPRRDGFGRFLMGHLYGPAIPIRIHHRFRYFMAILSDGAVPGASSSFSGDSNFDG